MRCAAALLLLAACDAASPDPGYGARLQIPGAQLRPGPFPSATGGPVSLSAATTHASLTIGNLHERLHGILAADARAAIIGLVGSDDAWIVPAGPPDTDAPGFATASAVFGLAADAPPGPYTLELAATGADGKIGEPAMVEIVAEAAPPPDGDLVIELAWDSAADLDLHVVDPLGGEAFSGSPNTWQPPPPGQPGDPTAFLTGGILDRDKNAGCHRDATAGEDVIWKTRSGPDGPVAPLLSPGVYIVRVEPRSLCTDASASWYVAAYRGGALVAAASGVSTPDDVQAVQGRGAGTTVLHFTLP